MVTAPLMVVLYDVVFVFESLRRALGERWRFYVASVRVLDGAGGGDVVRPARALGRIFERREPVDLPAQPDGDDYRYLRLAVWPRALVLNYGWPLAADARRRAAVCAAGTALLALTVVALVRRPKWGFLGAWFFVTLAPDVEHRADRHRSRRRAPHVSSPDRARGARGRVRVVLQAVSSAAGRGRRWRLWPRCFRLAISPGTASMPRSAARTHDRRAPSHERGHHMLGVVLLVGGDRDAAMSELRQAIPGAPSAHYTLGVELVKEGRTSEAIEQFQAFLREQPNLVEAIPARQLLGRALAQQGRWAKRSSRSSRC